RSTRRRARWCRRRPAGSPISSATRPTSRSPPCSPCLPSCSCRRRAPSSRRLLRRRVLRERRLRGRRLDPDPLVRTAGQPGLHLELAEALLRAGELLLLLPDLLAQLERHRRGLAGGLGAGRRHLPGVGPLGGVIELGLGLVERLLGRRDVAACAG